MPLCIKTDSTKDAGEAANRLSSPNITPTTTKEIGTQMKKKLPCFSFQTRSHYNLELLTFRRAMRHFIRNSSVAHRAYQKMMFFRWERRCVALLVHNLGSSCLNQKECHIVNVFVELYVWSTKHWCLKLLPVWLLHHFHWTQRESVLFFMLFLPQKTNYFSFCLSGFCVTWWLIQQVVRRVFSFVFSSA